jgi:hypothetical protein
VCHLFIPPGGRADEKPILIINKGETLAKMYTILLLLLQLQAPKNT